MNHDTFQLKALVIVRFNEHLKSVDVEDASQLLLVTYHDFYTPGVLHIKAKHGKKYLIEKDHTDVSFDLLFDIVIRLNNVSLSVD